jgi:branched-chain amino acid transport system ATP-binding protein
MSADVLRLEAVTAGYGSGDVLHDLELSVGAAEIVAILGPNGAGKTTTLRTISGLIRQARGRVILDGDDLSAVTPHARARLGIAHVPDDRGLFPGLTVAEHLQLGHRGERLAADVAYHSFPALSDLRNRRAGLLSGGEQHMLAVGRALARNPRLLILDELTHGLAPAVVSRLLPALRSVVTETGIAVLLVEQQVEQALELADRAYVLVRGTAVLEGACADLRRDRQLLIDRYFGRPGLAR